MGGAVFSNGGNVTITNSTLTANTAQGGRTAGGFTGSGLGGAIFNRNGMLPVVNSKGRALAAEIMRPNEAIRAMIREDKAHQVYSVIQTGSKSGMQTMNQSLFDLYRSGKITFDDALSYSGNPEDLKRTFQRMT